MQKKNLFSFHFRAKVPSRFASKVRKIRLNENKKINLICRVREFYPISEQMQKKKDGKQDKFTCRL